MLKLLILFICTLLFSADSFAAIKHETILLDTGTGDLSGTLMINESYESDTVALIIAGSGPTDRDGNNPAMNNNSLKLLAVELSKIGIASLRYDKRGVGKSRSAGTAEKELRFDHYINDATYWVEYLKVYKKTKQIIVIGHSEGSLIGMVASQHKYVDKFISIAGAGQPIDQVIRNQLKAQPHFVIEESTSILDKLLKGEMVHSVPVYLNALFRPSIQPYMISWFKYDPAIELAKLNKPVLIIQGTTDIQVSLADAENLSLANKKAQKVVIDQMNHIFKHATHDRVSNLNTYHQPDLPIKKELVSAIGAFVFH